MENPNIAVKDRFISAVLSRQKDKIGDLLDPNFELYQATGLEYAGVYKGHQGFITFLDKYSLTHTTDSIDLINTFVSTSNPDILVLELRSRGMLNSSGRKFDSTVLERWEFREGKLRSIVPHWFEIPK